MNWRDAKEWAGDNYIPVTLALICVLFVIGITIGIACDPGNGKHAAFCAKHHLSSSYYDETIGKTLYSHHFCYDKNGIVYFMTD